MRLLLVEDDTDIARRLVRELERAGFSCTWRENVSSGLTALRAEPVELVLLDLMLPDGTGFEFIEQARSRSQAPIIVLSARVVGDDKVRALELGADDYVTKPFSPRELGARIEALSRRPRTVDHEDERRLGDLVIRPLSRSVEVEGVPVELTRIERPDRILTVGTVRPGQQKCDQTQCSQTCCQDSFKHDG
jgi:DNA-binding response OmpR family regulator